MIDVTPNPVKPCTREDYTAYWYGCYKKHKTPHSWDSAKTICSEEGASLLSIMADAENAMVQLAATDDDLPLWTGGIDAEVTNHDI